MPYERTTQRNAKGARAESQKAHEARALKSPIEWTGPDPTISLEQTSSGSQREGRITPALAGLPTTIGGLSTEGRRTRPGRPATFGIDLLLRRSKAAERHKAGTWALVSRRSDATLPELLPPVRAFRGVIRIAGANAAKRRFRPQMCEAPLRRPAGPPHTALVSPQTLLLPAKAVERLTSDTGARVASRCGALGALGEPPARASRAIVLRASALAWELCIACGSLPTLCIRSCALLEMDRPGARSPVAQWHETGLAVPAVDPILWARKAIVAGARGL